MGAAGGKGRGRGRGRGPGIGKARHTSESAGRRANEREQQHIVRLLRISCAAREQRMLTKVVAIWFLKAEVWKRVQRSENEHTIALGCRRQRWVGLLRRIKLRTLPRHVAARCVKIANTLAKHKRRATSPLLPKPLPHKALRR